MMTEHMLEETEDMDEEQVILVLVVTPPTVINIGQM